MFRDLNIIMNYILIQDYHHTQGKTLQTLTLDTRNEHRISVNTHLVHIQLH